MKKLFTVLLSLAMLAIPASLFAGVRACIRQRYDRLRDRLRLGIFGSLYEHELDDRSLPHRR